MLRPWIVPCVVLSVGASAARAQMPISDDFSNPTLGSQWFVMAPLAPSYVSTSERPGFLRLSATVLNGSADYCSCDNWNAVRVLQNCSGDWTMETRMISHPSYNYNGSGIFAYFPGPSDSSAFRIAERAYYPSGGGQVVRSCSNYVPDTDSITYFRIVHHADTLSGWWSQDGITWNAGGLIFGSPNRIGVFAVCHDWDGAAAGRPMIADFDYIHFGQVVAVRAPGSPRAELSLRAPRPNPSRGRATISFSLASDADATLELFDVNGRRVFGRTLTGYGPGEHLLALEPARPLVPGLYSVRLTQAGHRASGRIVIVR